jgi:hypothetical protein
MPFPVARQLKYILVKIAFISSDTYLLKNNGYLIVLKGQFG